MKPKFVCTRWWIRWMQYQPHFSLVLTNCKATTYAPIPTLDLPVNDSFSIFVKHFRFHNNVTNLIHFHFHNPTTCKQPKATSARNSHQKLLVYRLLKMDAWRPKHVEDQDTIKWLWKRKCIKFVTLLWYIMIHGQQNVKFKVYLTIYLSSASRSAKYFHRFRSVNRKFCKHSTHPPCMLYTPPTSPLSSCSCLYSTLIRKDYEALHHAISSDPCCFYKRVKHHICKSV
jgi:hypothetical protein